MYPHVFRLKVVAKGQDREKILPVFVAHAPIAYPV